MGAYISFELKYGLSCADVFLYCRKEGVMCESESC